MKKILSIVLAMVLCLSVMTACGSSGTQTPDTSAPAQSASAEPAAKDTTLRSVGIMTSENFNPLVNGNGDKEVFHALFDCLFMFDNDGNPVNMLAETWTKEGREVTIKIVENATFSSGNTVKASDIVFTYNEYLKDPQLQYNMTMFFTNCEVVDDFTVKFTLANSYCKWMNLLSELFYVVEESSYDPEADFSQVAPVGSGAYTLESVDTSRVVTLTARDDYWRLTPDFKTVIVNPSMDASTQLIALQTGELDLAPQLGLNIYSQADATDGITAVAFNGWTTMGMMNLSGDDAFRQACAYAINRDTLLAICNGGNGEPSTNAFSPKVMGDYTDAVDPIGYDPDMAKECLAKSSADLSATYTITVFDDDSAAVAQCIQSDLRAIGINAEVSQVDINTWFDSLMAGTLDMTCVAMATDMVGAEDMMSMFDPDAGYPFPISAEMIDMVKTAPYIDDDTARHEAMVALLNQINVECPWVPLFDSTNYMAYNSRITNINDCGAGTCVFYFADMKLA